MSRSTRYARAIPQYETGPSRRGSKRSTARRRAGRGSDFLGNYRGGVSVGDVVRVGAGAVAAERGSTVSYRASKMPIGDPNGEPAKGLHVAASRRRRPGRGLSALSFGAAQPNGRRQKIEIVALDDLTLEVGPGEIFGLLGPNGAGKSTTVGVLTTRIRPTGGPRLDRRRRRLEGAGRRQAADRRRAAAAEPRLLADGARDPHVPRRLLRDARRRTALARAQELLERFQLTDRADQLVVGFSGGMMQRLSIARAMMHDPEVLFLDEPSAGLDPQTRLLLWEIVRDYNARGNTIVLTTHNMEEADELCVARRDRGPRQGHRARDAVGAQAIDPGRLSHPSPALASDARAPRGARAPAGRDRGRGRGRRRRGLYADRGGPLVPGS